jgi:hypothetical protein
MIIEYKGKTVDTKFYKELTNEEYIYLKNEYFKKPDFEKVKLDFINLSNGNLKNTNITNYYFKDLMAKTRIYYNKYSVEELFEHKPLIEFVVGKVIDNPKVFNPKDPLIKNVEAILRIGTKRVASKVSNFPIKTANHIIKKYNINGNYYDFSCGWGVRLTTALMNNVNYYGTDPNYILVDRLNNLTNDYKNQIKNCVSSVNIKPTGSEIYNQDWENKIGLAFSSPPYYNLEDYKIGEQSWKDGVSYQTWLEKYFVPTVKNIYKYLIKEGLFAINVKNFGETKKYNLLDDCKKIILENGFVFIGLENLQNIQRKKNTGEMLNNDEAVMLFKKDTNEKIIEIKEEKQTNIFDYIGGKI